MPLRHEASVTSRAGEHYWPAIIPNREPFIGYVSIAGGDERKEKERGFRVGVRINYLGLGRVLLYQGFAKQDGILLGAGGISGIPPRWNRERPVPTGT